MTGTRFDPRVIEPSDVEGDVLQTIDGVTAWGPGAVQPSPLVTVVGGIPGLIFDDDGQIVYAEGPL